MAEKKTKFELIVGAIDRFSAPFASFNRRMEESTRGLKQLAEASRNLKRETGFGRLAAEGKNVSSAFGNVFTEGRALFDRLTGMAGRLSLVFGAAGGGLFALTHSTAAAGDEAIKSAQRAGVGLEAWQEYAHAAKLADVSNEELQKSFQKLNENKIKALTGGDEQALWFKRAGVKLKTKDGKMKDTDSLYMEVAESIKKFTDKGELSKANALAKGIFGKSGQELMPLLNAGAAGLRELREEARTLGLVLEKDTADSSEQFNDSLERTHGSLRGTGYLIGKEVLPYATELSDEFRAWVLSNREMVKTRIAEWMQDFKVALPGLKTGFFEFCAGVKRGWNMLSGFVEFIGGWGNAFLGLGAIMAGPFLLAVGGAIKAVLGFGVALLTTPVGWIIAGIAAIAGGAYLIHKNWDGLSGYFSGLWAEVGAAFEQNWFGGVVQTLLNFNPMRWVFDGVNTLIKYLTGVDLKASAVAMLNSFFLGMQEGWAEITGWFDKKLAGLRDMLPDFMKRSGGQKNAEAAGGTLTGTSAGAAASRSTSDGSPFLGPPAGAQGLTRSLNEKNAVTTRVERREVTGKLIPPPGWSIEWSGGGLDGTGMYSGLQMQPGT